MIVDDGWMDRESGVSMKKGCDSEIVYTKGIADLEIGAHVMHIKRLTGCRY